MRLIPILVLLVAAGQMAAQTVTGTLTVRGRLDAAQAVSTSPARVVTSLPATCATGQAVLLTTAPLTEWLHVCTAANVWTRQVTVPAWNAITGRPSTFPPSAHAHGAGDLPGSVLYSTVSYPDPAWLTSLGWGKLTGVPATFPPAAHAHGAGDLPASVLYSTGSYANPGWLTSLAGSKISGAVPTAAALAANGSNCAAGQAAGGVDAAGNAEDCFTPGGGGGGGGGGTVTSVGLSAPAELTVSGSPVTTSGTLGLSWASQTANSFFLGPASGAAAAPGFRAMVLADIPAGLRRGNGSLLQMSAGTPAHGQMAGYDANLNLVGVATTGSGDSVRATSPTIVTPILTSFTAAGRPAAGVAGRVIVITDASAAGNCDVGGGSALAYCRDSGTAWVPLGDGGTGGGGTVTSVGLATPAELTVASSPITTSGSIALGWATQGENRVFAGPVGSPAAVPNFRSLAAADLPGSVLYSTGSYANPPWLTSLGWSKLTGAPADWFHTAGLSGANRPIENALSGSHEAFFSTPNQHPGWPVGANSWWHLINSRHNNMGSYYALQIAGSFFDQNLWMRKTNNSNSTSWSQILTTALPEQINFHVGGRPAEVIPATTFDNVWRAHAYNITVTEIACWTNQGTVTLTIRRDDGVNLHAGISCSSSGASTTAITASGVPLGRGIGYVTSSVSNVQNLSVSIRFARHY